eukprot:TRINITY_DN104161_c0_g1_i1.p1 TRINITY_DN104161_c0_g1~~TRINITY_DN104161_c0_g1_i1.p1  ORF type:complete len:561 (-),score=99.54 TRINITY_DN104161_c0_g1_i1:6-1688(-)
MESAREDEQQWYSGEQELVDVDSELWNDEYNWLVKLLNIPTAYTLETLYELLESEGISQDVVLSARGIERTSKHADGSVLLCVADEAAASSVVAAINGLEVAIGPEEGSATMFVSAQIVWHREELPAEARVQNVPAFQEHNMKVFHRAENSGSCTAQDHPQTALSSGIARPSKSKRLQALAKTAAATLSVPAKAPATMLAAPSRRVGLLAPKPKSAAVPAAALASQPMPTDTEQSRVAASLSDAWKGEHAVAPDASWALMQDLPKRPVKPGPLLQWDACAKTDGSWGQRQGACDASGWSGGSQSEQAGVQWWTDHANWMLKLSSVPSDYSIATIHEMLQAASLDPAIILASKDLKSAWGSEQDTKSLILHVRDEASLLSMINALDGLEVGRATDETADTKCLSARRYDRAAELTAKTTGGGALGSGPSGGVFPSVYLVDIPAEYTQQHVHELHIGVGLDVTKIVSLKFLPAKGPSSETCSYIVRYRDEESAQAAIKALQNFHVLTRSGAKKWLGARMARPANWMLERGLAERQIQLRRETRSGKRKHGEIETWNQDSKTM